MVAMTTIDATAPGSLAPDGIERHQIPVSLETPDNVAEQSLGLPKSY
jgi:hypothetical protein